MDTIFKQKKPSSCWKGYIAVGMKKKGDRYVPNCVLKSGKHKTLRRNTKKKSNTRKYRK